LNLAQASVTTGDLVWLMKCVLMVELTTVVVRHTDRLCIKGIELALILERKGLDNCVGE